MMTLSRYAGCLLVGLTVLTAATASCGSSASSDNNEAAADTLATASNGVEIEYSSSEALNAPAYDPDAELGSPLALEDVFSPYSNQVTISDVGAYSLEGDNKMKYDVWLNNQSPDTITIKSIKLPDSTFELYWRGEKTYKPGLMSTFQLRADSAVAIDDYRFIITYEGDKYAPQVFHINLHPDLDKLVVEKRNK